MISKHIEDLRSLKERLIENYPLSLGESALFTRRLDEITNALERDLRELNNTLSEIRKTINSSRL